MKFTNKHGLPEPMVRALSSSKYSKGDARISITGLMGSPRINVLKSLHADEIEVDVMDRLWAVFGTTVHNILEEGSQGLADYVAEERIDTELDGWKVSGGIDLQHFEDRSVGLRDWKVTGAWAVMNGKPDWERQLNAYAYLVEKEHGHVVRDIQVGVIVRDWKRFEAERNSAYPQKPAVMIDIPLWGMKAREKYLLERIALHKEAYRLQEWGEPLPDCTAEEMWEKPTTYAVKKVGGSRAISVHSNRKDAIEKAMKTKNAMETRPGERVRCDSYCEVARFCDQYQAYLKSRE